MLSPRLEAIPLQKVLYVRTPDTANFIDSIARNAARLQEFLGFRFPQAQPLSKVLSREPLLLLLHYVLQGWIDCTATGRIRRARRSTNSVRLLSLCSFHPFSELTEYSGRCQLSPYLPICECKRRPY